MNLGTIRMAAASAVSIALLLTGCAHTENESPTAQYAPIKGVTISMEVPYGVARTVWCKPADQCFEQAAIYCGSEDPNSDTRKQHYRHGNFHQVAEPGQVFPAIYQEKDGWSRMMIVCDQ